MTGSTGPMDLVLLLAVVVLTIIAVAAVSAFGSRRT
jgi:nitrate reductase NapE component